MALDQSALSELLEAIRAGGDIDVLRSGMQLLLQELIELEASQVIGAARYERSADRLTQRNGSRGRRLSTKAGDVELAIPKLRSGSFFPSLLEPRRRIDRALWAVIMEAYVHGVSTRKVDDLVQALGIHAGVSKSEVSRICAELDEAVGAFRHRELGHTRFPYLFLDATYVKAHTHRSVVSKAVVIATGVTAAGQREVLGCAVGDSEDGAFWTSFLRELRGRGLSGVQLVISDAHAGLKVAIGSVLLGAAWQRCRVHLLRNVLAHVPRINAELVAALVRTIFVQPDQPSAQAQLDLVVERLAPRYPAAAEVLAEAREEVTSYAVFPRAHWRKIWSTNPIERVNAEIKRRTNVVGIFPNENGVLRLVGSVLLEVHEEWAVDERRYLSTASMARMGLAVDDGWEQEVESRLPLLAS